MGNLFRQTGESVDGVLEAVKVVDNNGGEILAVGFGNLETVERRGIFTAEGLVIGAVLENLLGAHAVKDCRAGRKIFKAHFVFEIVNDFLSAEELTDRMKVCRVGAEFHAGHAGNGCLIHNSSALGSHVLEVWAVPHKLISLAWEFQVADNRAVV